MISYSNNEIKLNNINESNYKYELEYTDDAELSLYYNKLVLSLYGKNQLRFVDGNKFNLTSGNVVIQ